MRLRAFAPSREDSVLPPWFKRPQRCTGLQLSLFQVRVEDALAHLQISPDELSRWHLKGWASFNASTLSSLNDYDDPRIWELCFLRDLVRSGLTDAQIDWLLQQLPKPYAFDPHSVVFSFHHGWVEAMSFIEMNEIVDKHIDAWLEECDEDELRSLHDKIDRLLEPSDEENLEN